MPENSEKDKEAVPYGSGDNARAGREGIRHHVEHGGGKMYGVHMYGAGLGWLYGSGPGWRYRRIFYSRGNGWGARLGYCPCTGMARGWRFYPGYHPGPVYPWPMSRDDEIRYLEEQKKAIERRLGELKK